MADKHEAPSAAAVDPGPTSTTASADSPPPPTDPTDTPPAATTDTATSTTAPPAPDASPDAPTARPSPAPLWSKPARTTSPPPTNTQTSSVSPPPPGPPPKPLTAAEYKDRGNAYMTMRAYGKAIREYSEGLALDPDNAVLRTNRAAARYNLGLYLDSLADANAAVAADPAWWKAYRRQALALFSLERYDDALTTLEKAIERFPDHGDELRANLDTLNKLVERVSMLYTFPGTQLMSKLDTVPVFLVADALGQPYFITYEDGQQICTFYFEYDEAVATLEWIRQETPKMGAAARVVPVALSHALKLTQETNEAILKEEDARAKEREKGTDAATAPAAPAAAPAGGADAEAAGAEQQGNEEGAAKEQPLTFNFKADAKALEDAVELLKNPPPPPPPKAESGAEEGKKDGEGGEEKKDTEDANAESKKEAPPAPPPSIGGHTLRDVSKPEDVLPPVDYQSLTVENFNGIPIFQAKGLTLIQKEQQYIPLFFTRTDLQAAWEMLKTNGTFGVEEAPDQCEIDVGTLEDVLRRMAESEKSGEFSNVVFVAIREARKHAGPDFPVDEVTKATLDAPPKKPRNHKFQDAVKIKAQGGSNDAIREAIRKQLASAVNQDKRFEDVLQRHQLVPTEESSADPTAASA